MVGSGLLTDEEQALALAYRRKYRSDPVGWERDVLGIPAARIWSKMRAVAEGLRDHQLVAVPAGHSVSKTYQMGRLIVWFKTLFQPSTVITTAPCYDGQTEILTEDGWCRFPDLREGVKVACLDDGRRLVFERPRALIEYDYDGEMIGYCGQNLDFLVTPEHRCWVRTGDRPFRLRPAHEIEGVGGWCFKRDCTWRGRKDKWSLKHYELWGFWFGDGSVECRSKKNRVTLTQKKYVDYAADLLSVYGFEVHRDKRRDDPSRKIKDVWNLTIYDKKTAAWFTKHFKQGSRKVIPAWVRNASKAKLTAFIRGYMKADGHEASGSDDQTRITSRTKGLMDAVQEIALKCGYVTNLRTVNTKAAGWSGAAVDYRLSFLCRGGKFKADKAGWYREPYAGSVYCVTTRTGVIMVRRNGVYHWSGNSENQVKNQLWREVHGAWSGSRQPLGGKMTALQWDLRPSESFVAELPVSEREWWSKNFAMGFSTSPDTVSEYATKIAGWHNKWVLIVLDEACGISPQIWNTAIEGLVTNERVKMIAIGNPTDPESEFANVCRLGGRLDHLYAPGMSGSHAPYMSDMGWWVIPISVRDTPNYKEGKEVIPGLAGRSYEQMICRKHPVGSNGWLVRVGGAFPAFKEGTYYGHELAQARLEGRVGRYPHDPTYRVYRFADFGDHWTAAVDVQFIRDRVRVINDYWDNEGLGAPAMCRSMQAMPYRWGNEHYAGPDLDPEQGSNARQFSTGKTVRDTLRGLGFNFVAVDKHKFNDGIEATRHLWRKTDVDAQGAGTFLKAAKGYGKSKDMRHSTPDEPAYHNQPANTWHRHMMDAWRHCAVRYAHGTIDGEYLGRHETVAQYVALQAGKQVDEDWDPMEYV